MTKAYYNENDAFAAHWLYNLIQQNLIAPGDIDTRDIRDVRPKDLDGYAQCHFFAGIGGWSRALRLAGVPDDRPLWTGSCPCQPFSQAGRRGGFADERHLWPYWHYLIAQRRPATIFGEQVASAADWLRLVRGDLEALDYAVGAMPVEAASAGADHLRDRFWFVAHAALPASERQRQHGREILSLEKAVGRGGSGDMGHASGAGLEIRSIAEVERGHLRDEGATIAPSGPGSIAVADADQPQWRLGNKQSARQQPEQQRDQEARAGGDLSNTQRERVRGERSAALAGAEAGVQGADEERQRLWSDTGAVCDSQFEWAIGADGKARRIKPGVRLLVDGFPNRVGLLRGFGNAIDPRPAAAFITAALGVLDTPPPM